MVEIVGLEYSILVSVELTPIIPKNMERNFALVVTVGNQFYGLDSRYINEVLIYQYVNRQPDMEAPFVGTVTLRGQKIPVINAASHLIGRTRKISNSATIVVLRSESAAKTMKVAVMVDSIEDLTEISNYLDAEKGKNHNKQMRYVQGVFQYQGETVLDIDIELFAFNGSKRVNASVAVAEVCVA